MNTRDSTYTELNVLADFNPCFLNIQKHRIPDAWKPASFHSEISDSSNDNTAEADCDGYHEFWIDSALPELKMF
jgi:hypothetical protein